MMDMEQRRASSALNFVKSFKNSPKKKELKNKLKALPALLQSNGLAIVFLHLCEKGDFCEKIAENLCVHLHEIFPGQTFSGCDLHKIAENVLRIERFELVNWTQEAKLYASWLKRTGAVWLSDEGGN